MLAICARRSSAGAAAAAEDGAAGAAGGTVSCVAAGSPGAVSLSFEARLRLGAMVVVYVRDHKRSELPRIGALCTLVNAEHAGFARISSSIAGSYTTFALLCVPFCVKLPVARFIDYPATVTPYQRTQLP